MGEKEHEPFQFTFNMVREIEKGENLVEPSGGRCSMEPRLGGNIGNVGRHCA